MPRRDTIHHLVRQALVKAGWEITADPFIINYEGQRLLIDLAAVEAPTLAELERQIIGAQREGRQIAIEVKTFSGASTMADLEQAIGQYVLYRLLLSRIEPERELYLAVTGSVYREVFGDPVGEVVVNDLSVNLLVVDEEKGEVELWIP